MKKIMILFITLATLLMTGCNRGNDEQQEQGVTVNIEIPSADPLSGTVLWFFDATDNTLKYEYKYSNATQIAAELQKVAPGDYTVIMINNAGDAFTYDAQVGVTKVEDLLVKITDPSSSLAHIHYGKTSLQVSATGISPIKLSLHRVLTELQFTVKGIPAVVKEVQIKIINASDGFYPGAGRLSPVISEVDLGNVPVVDEMASFPVKRIMPIVGTAAGGTDELKTRIQFSFIHSDGTSITQFEAEMPQIQNGGSYYPEVPFKDFVTDLVLQINNIKKWEGTESISGDVVLP